MCAPDPPDPRETASASTTTNVGTAIANANLNNVNQVTPDGTLTYNQSGAYDWFDPYTKQTYNIPKFTATQTLSPEQQAIKAQTDKAKLNLGTLASNQSGFLNDYMSKPFDGSNEATEARLMELGRKRLDPLFAQQQESLNTQLSNQGIKLGSTAYDRAQSQFGQNQNDAYNQLLLTGRGQAFSEAQALRNQPINEITALLSGSQVSQPNLVNSPTNQIPTTDVAGIISDNYQQRLAASQMSGGILGGLFGLGGKLIGLSDDDAKKDKTRHGDIGEGMGLWTFRYKDEPKSTPKHLGLMASEVEDAVPEAVSRRPDGYRQVDYGKVFGLG